MTPGSRQPAPRSIQIVAFCETATVLQGWINYYGRFYKSELLCFLRRLNRHLVRWACRKYKRLKRRERRAMAWLAEIARRSPRLFAHWKLGACPDGWAMGAG